jgi:hypothetical protein
MSVAVCRFDGYFETCGLNLLDLWHLSHCGGIDGFLLCLNVAVTENMHHLDGIDDLKKAFKSSEPSGNFMYHLA